MIIRNENENYKENKNFKLDVNRVLYKTHII